MANSIRRKAALFFSVRNLSWLLIIGPIYLLTRAIAVIPRASGSFSELLVFNTDEHMLANLVWANIGNRDLDPRGFFWYGYVYQTLGYFLLKVQSFFGSSVDQWEVVVVMRALSFAAYVLTGGAFERMLSFFKISLIIRIGLVALLLLSPELFYYSVVIHPDTLQTFLMVFAGVIALYGRGRTRALFGAAVVSGLALGTKFSGVFIWPFLCLPYMVEWYLRAPSGKLPALRAVGLAICLSLVVVLVWLVTNPYVIQGFSTLLEQQSQMAATVATGWGKQESSESLQWLPVLAKQYGYACLTVMGIAFPLGIYSWCRQESAEATRGRFERNIFFAIAAYCTLLVLYFGFLVRMREFRYLFPLLPFFLVICGCGIEFMVQKIRAKQSALAFACVGLLGLLVVPASKCIGQVEEFARANEHPAFAAGRYIKNKVALQSCVLADWYSLELQGFRCYVMLGGVTLEEIERRQADVVVLTKEMTGRWAWKKEKTLFADRNFQVDSSYGERSHQALEFLQLLSDPTGVWRPAFEADEIIVFQKATSSEK